MKMWLVATHVIFNRNVGGSFSCIFHGKTKSAVSVPRKHPFTNFKKWYSQKTSGWYIVNCFVRFGMDPAGSLLYTLYPRCKGSLLSCLVASFPDYPWCPKIGHVKKRKLDSNPRYGLASTPKISEHFLWTQNKHLLQKIEFFLTPFLHTRIFTRSLQCMEISTQYNNFGFPMFTFNLFDSIPFFHTAIFVIRPSNLSAKITRSSA